MSGGETGIRTLGTRKSTHAFQACALNHSAISPDPVCIHLQFIILNGCPPLPFIHNHLQPSARFESPFFLNSPLSASNYQLETNFPMVRMFHIATFIAVTVGSANGQSQVSVMRPEPETKAAPATPIAEKKVELGQETWDPSWDLMVEEVLPADLLTPTPARDVKQFCPRFNAMNEVDKRSFWAYFFQALAGAEAGLEPTKNVRHTEAEVAVKDDVTKRLVRSEGLLQLTYMDADRYGCDFDWEKDKLLDEHDPDKTILQPKNNLTCGVKILRSQLVAQRKPLLSKSSYWSTLRPGWPGYLVFTKQMTNVSASCGRKPSRVESRTAGTRVAANAPALRPPAE